MPYQRLQSTRDSRVPETDEYQRQTSTRDRRVPETAEYQRQETTRDSRVPETDYQRLQSTRDRLPETAEYQRQMTVGGYLVVQHYSSVHVAAPLLIVAGGLHHVLRVTEQRQVHQLVI